jgi:hypothetical protein
MAKKGTESIDLFSINKEKWRRVGVIAQVMGNISLCDLILNSRFQGCLTRPLLVLPIKSC